MSRDATGRGTAFGFKAALDEAVAADGAIMELLQMEIALELARHRAAEQAPTPDDLRILRLADLDSEAFPCFVASATEAPYPRLAGLDDLVARLASRGHRVVATDLAGPPAGLAVAKVTATGLRPFPGGGRAKEGAPGAFADLM
jgi:ribosomal protein S12 methylthiotransferase accessory factor YcaO